MADVSSSERTEQAGCEKEFDLPRCDLEVILVERGWPAADLLELRIIGLEETATFTFVYASGHVVTGRVEAGGAWRWSCGHAGGALIVNAFSLGATAPVRATLRISRRAISPAAAFDRLYPAAANVAAAVAGHSDLARLADATCMAAA